MDGPLVILSSFPNSHLRRSPMMPSLRSIRAAHRAQAKLGCGRHAVPWAVSIFILALAGSRLHAQSQYTVTIDPATPKPPTAFMQGFLHGASGSANFDPVLV